MRISMLQRPLRSLVKLNLKPIKKDIIRQFFSNFPLIRVEVLADNVLKQHVVVLQVCCVAKSLICENFVELLQRRLGLGVQEAGEFGHSKIRNYFVGFE